MKRCKTYKDLRKSRVHTVKKSCPRSGRNKSHLATEDVNLLPEDRNHQGDHRLEDKSLLLHHQGNYHQIGGFIYKTKQLQKDAILIVQHSLEEVCSYGNQICDL